MISMMGPSMPLRKSSSPSSADYSSDPRFYFVGPTYGARSEDSSLQRDVIS